MNLSKTQINGIKILDVFRLTDLTGWLLLARPVIYLVFSRRRDISESASIDSSAMIFILYAFVCFYVAAKDIFESKNDDTELGTKILFNSPLIWFIAYSVLAFFSMFWSVNLMLTGFRAFECIALMFLIVAVIKNLFLKGSLKFVILWSMMYAIWEILFSIIRILMWTTSINVILESSQEVATTFFYIALYFTPYCWYNYLIIVMSVLSMSTVAYIGMALGAVSAFWAKDKIKVAAYFATFIIMIAVILIGPHDLIKNTLFFDKQEISITETSGRDFLMEASIDSIKKNPYGLGFSAAEPYVFFLYKIPAISAHNSIFSAGLGMGIPGIILFVVFILSCIRSVLTSHIPKTYKPMLIGCLSVAILHCMGNPSVGSRVYGAWMCGMYIFVLVCGFYVYGKNYIIEDEDSYCS